MNRKLLVTLLLSVFVLTSLFAVSTKNPGSFLTPPASSDRNYNSQGTTYPVTNNREQWDLQFVFSPDDVTGVTGNTGCETDGTYIYTTVWTTADIYKWDMQGNLIESFTIAGVSALRDLAYDGTYFYGGCANTYIWEMDFENHTLISTINTPAAVRAIAYDEEADGFWFNNWGTELILVNRSGTQIGSMGTPNDDMYGAAYDPYSEGGPYFWQFNGGASGCLIQQTDMEGNYTGVTYDPQTALGDTGISGGFWISEGVVAGKASIGGLMQGTTSDKAFAFELCDTAPADSPGQPTNFVVTPNASGNLTAVLTWTNPSVTATGATLTSLTEMRIYRNDTLIHTISNPTIGAAATWTDSSVPSAGSYQYRVVGYNAAGEGLPASYNTWVGQDVPSAVSNFSLANDEGNAQLTWTNPTTGLHGGAFTMPIQGYHLVRSDGATIELTGIMTSYLDETIPVENNYSYTITPYNAVGDGGEAATDVMWIGNSIGVTIGTGTSTTNQLPLDYYYCNSLSETIFMADEIGAGGITGGALTHILLYYNFITDLPDMPVNLYVGETTETTLTGSWINANSLQQVYSGTMHWEIGQNTAVFVLDDPYVYNGGNLVVMFNRPMDTQYYSSSNVFFISQTPEYPGRTRFVYSDGTTFDPYAPPTTANTTDYHPNITLLFNTDGMGALEGHVYDTSGNPIPEAQVTLNEMGLTRNTNAEGLYTYPAVYAGTYSLTAGKFGYGSVTTTNVNIVADQTTTVDFTLPDLITVNVTGMVAGSDYPAVGLVGASVMLDGYDHFETTTGAGGLFSIPSVYGNNTYAVTVEYEGYETYIGEAVIGGVDIDLGTIIVNEIAYAPYGAVATLNGAGTAVDLTWVNPNPDAAQFFDFEGDDGGFISNNTSGWQWGTDATYGAHSGTNIWGTVLGATYPVNCNFTLDTPEFTIASDEAVLTFWHCYYMESSWDGGNVKISTDGGSSWTVITPVGGYPDDAASSANAAIPEEPCYTGNSAAWAIATFEVGAYVGQDVMFRFHMGSDSSVQYNGWFIDDVYVGIPETRGQNSSNGAVRFITSYNTRPLTRSLEYFDVYHFLYEELNTPEEWDLVATGVADTVYSDTSWATLPEGVYFWGIKAVYTNNVESEAAVTNWLGKDMYTSLTVNVSTATGDPTDGAEVSLTGLTADPDGNTYDYDGVVAGGTVVFPNVWRGFYNIDVYLEGFAPWSAENYEVTEPTIVDVTLGENLNPVNGLVASVTANDVYLQWTEPVDAVMYDFEANDGDFVSNNTSGWQWGVDNTMGAYSGTNVWGTVLNGAYPNDCDFTLDSPEITVPGNAQLTFFFKMYCESYFDGGNVKVSTDGGSSWTLITPVGGYPEDAASTSNASIPGEACYTGTMNSTWNAATFELTDYYGQSVMFRFSFGSDGSVTYTGGWFIDDVRVGAPEVRSLLNYNIYRNTVLIDQVDPDQFTYADMDLADGTYTYDVTALYTTGESDARTVTVEVYPVDVSGYVNTSDAPGVGLTGALVVLQNEDFYFEYTTVNGNFLFDEINGQQTYTLTIEYEGYDSYETELTVTSSDVNLGTITLVELLNPVSNVIAIENASQTQVDIMWNMPGNGTLTEFRWDDGTATGQLGYTGGSSTAILGSLHNNDAQITEVSWYLTSEGGPHPSVNIFVFMLGADGYPDANQLLYTVTGVTQTDEQWNTFTLPDPVDTPDGFYVALNCPSYFLALGTDDGVDDPYVFQTGTQLVTSDYTNPTWYSIEAYGYPYNFLLRENGYDFGALESRASQAYQPKIRPETAGLVYNNIRSRNTGEPQWTPETQSLALSRDTRELEGFSIYRLLEEDENNMNNWATCTLTQAADDSTYTDTDWATLESGVYEWAVIANYTNGLQSTPSFSNTVPRSMMCTVTLTITCNDGSSAQGAEVVFTNTDGVHTYTAVAPGNGVVVQTVWAGLYTIEISLGHYDAYLATNVVCPNPEIELDVELEETLLPVVGLEYEEDDPDVHLWWLDPYTVVGWTEDFEGGSLPQDWTMTTNSAVGWFITQEGSSSYWTVPSHTYYACSNDDAANDDGSMDYLITPSQDFSTVSEMTMSFDSFYNGDYSQEAYVEVSSDGGSSWDVAATMTAADDWANVTVDLSAYCGAGFDDVLIAFHADDAGTWASGWAVDNVVLGDGGEREVQLTRKEIATRNEQISTRSLLGYRVERHGQASGTTVLTEQTTDFEWYDTPYNDTYVYYVFAVFTTGLSDPLMTDEIVITENPWSVGPNPDDVVATALKGNYPNPFNPVTNIAYSVKEAGNVSIEIYNVKGQLVRTLVNERMEAGNHDVVWNGTDNNGRAVSSGVFFCRMITGDYTSTQKMILLK